ncbi:MAG: Nif3-like dinuclear metal center hexameric protein [Candidatus Cloacimonetes bacterium]|nr:Nif3-like dinuclear metal center hexameric protein [Candidatus Cloacimonadota bacterium]
MMKVSQVLEHIEHFAPLGLALSWDNVGLLLGDKNWEVSKALICLDVTPNAVDVAINSKCDIIISHHPLIFRPLKSIVNPLYIKLIQQQIAVICLHTNLDVAKVSVNHILAKRLGLEVLYSLSEESGATSHHIQTYCPPDAAERICEAALKAVAGGCQSSVCTVHNAEGITETSLEFSCDSFSLSGVLHAIRFAHPYETPLIIHHPLESRNPAFGLGLVCRYPESHSLAEIALVVKQQLACPQIKLWLAGKKPEDKIDRIAICGGSGASLLSAANAKAQLFISGDISYHNFLDSHIPIIDAGHFYTEYPVLDFLSEQLNALALPNKIMPMQEHEYAINMELL